MEKNNTISVDDLMNPFKITETEYSQNFGEKKNFLKSLIFLIFKGATSPTKIEDMVINQTLVEYYEAFFHPFNGFTDEEKEKIRKRLLLEDKKNGVYEKFEEEFEKSHNDREPDQGGFKFTADENIHYKKVERRVEKLHNLINDKAASEGEKKVAGSLLVRLMSEVMGMLIGAYIIRYVPEVASWLIPGGISSSAGSAAGGVVSSAVTGAASNAAGTAATVASLSASGGSTAIGAAANLAKQYSGRHGIRHCVSCCKCG